MDKNEKNYIDLVEVAKTLWAKKKVFFKLWPIVFIVSCVWIFPQPRYYVSQVSLAPETASEDLGGLSSLASSFGFNVGGGNSNDAFYPMLYPDILESNEFVTGLFGVQVETLDGSLKTDYYTYLSKHKKKNPYTAPIKKMKRSITQWFSSKETPKPGSGKDVNPFRLSEYDFNLVQSIIEDITCSVDKKTDVITISVKDQDPLVSATMADSVSQHLQDFIISYRTHKARIDMEHYQEMADNALKEYKLSADIYSEYCDSHINTTKQSQENVKDRLLKEMEMKYSTYGAMSAQLEAAKTKLQERTPSFTTLKGACVPIKPDGPKRMLFVLGMLFLSTFIACLWMTKDFFFGKK